MKKVATVAVEMAATATAMVVVMVTVEVMEAVEVNVEPEMEVEVEGEAETEEAGRRRGRRGRGEEDGEAEERRREYMCKDIQQAPMLCRACCLRLFARPTSCRMRQLRCNVNCSHGPTRVQIRSATDLPLSSATPAFLSCLHGCGHGKCTLDDALATASPFQISLVTFPPILLGAFPAERH